MNIVGAVMKNLKIRRKQMNNLTSYILTIMIGFCLLSSGCAKMTQTCAEAIVASSGGILYLKNPEEIAYREKMGYDKHFHSVLLLDTYDTINSHFLAKYTIDVIGTKGLFS